MAQQTPSPKKSAPAKKAKAAAPKTATRTKAAKLDGPSLSDAERFRMIAEAAYLKAESRGFEGGNPTEDWLQAEAEVDARYAPRH